MRSQHRNNKKAEKKTPSKPIKIVGFFYFAKKWIFMG